MSAHNLPELAPAANTTGKPWRHVSIGVAVVCAVLFVALVGATVTKPTMSSVSATVLPSGINQATADLMSLESLSGDRSMPSPALNATNEDGTKLDLARFHGHVVVLSFNDDQCEDLCALFAQDIVAANRDLSAKARSQIEFVSVNANPFYPSTSDVESWSVSHGLSTMRNWYFGTGTPAKLAQQAQAFGVPIGLDPSTKTVTHGSEIFIIGPDGHYVDDAEFGTGDADTEPFAHGLAVVANDALPKSNQGRVRGHNLAAPLDDGTEIGDVPEPISGPSVTQSVPLSSADDRGQYAVLDFWSSTCTACADQLDAAEAEHQVLGSQVAFLGVDVDDSTQSATAELAAHKVSFLVLSDTNGTQAGRFKITGLPFTVILSPKGKVLVRHPGVFSQEELDYVLRNTDQELPAGS
jgi:cytochrome oxidase Cu insertion factor (SCO1/SenC/PrrC family)/thiol-disulfide isomerase/thioredoxin